jgi:hypothetical protein
LKKLLALENYFYYSLIYIFSGSPSNDWVSSVVMFFKLHSFYRQFSQFSIRLATKKLSTVTGNSLSLTSMSGSPLRIRHGASKNRSEFFTGMPSPFGIELQFQQKRSFYRTSSSKQQTPSKVNLESPTLSVKHGDIVPEAQCDNLNYIFPLLTGEELRAFDSSVYE